MHDIAVLGDILGLWAHPDDETFTSAGLFAAAAAAGQTVVCVTATKGEAGVRNPDKWPPKKLGEIRAQELSAALQILGIGECHHWLGLVDGECNAVQDDVVLQQLHALLEQYRPNTIVTFPPDGMTGHSDHQAVSAWARALVAAADWSIRLLYVVPTRESYDTHLKDMDAVFDIFFGIEEPRLVAEKSCDLLLTLTPELQEKKYQALAAMPSQTSAMLDAYPRAYICDAFRTEGFVDAAHYANS
jgi:LmbE family N-acetylglucosaminyl deacetylase